MTKKEQTEQQKANAAAKLAIATEASASGVKKSIKTKAKAGQPTIQPVKKKPIKAKAKVPAKKEPVVDEKRIEAEIAKAVVMPVIAPKPSFLKKLKFW
tara:strand:- start:1167 stop:1460 length:294 start_codon:yes stop_codon:yes gene_type:complete